MNKNNLKIKVTAKVLPENASLKEINWKPVLKECVSSDFISVIDIESGSNERGVETKIIQAEADGECILRCTCQNNTEYDEVISDLPFSVTGLGSKNLNPYSLIEAIRFSDWNREKEKPEITLESGISNRKCGNTWVSYDKIDFGKDGADTIHLPIFCFSTEFPIEIYEGNGIDGECLGQFTYMHESIYNTYSENVFVLNRRLFGVHTITINILIDLYLHGFYFDKTPKAFAKLRALDANLIAGDSFKKTDYAVEGIGNNVNLDFYDMNFGDIYSKRITICGKSNTDNNTINIKFFEPDGSSTTEVIEFEHTERYEEKTFKINSVKGEKNVSFVFLPGSNFDFKWFQFE